MGIRHTLRKTLWRFGYDISKFTPQTNQIARRKFLFNSYAIDVILDVGANTGDFAKEMRNDIGFKGKIFSFEPLSSAFKVLSKNAENDSRWETLNYALGEQDASLEINVANRSESSSLLNMLSTHKRAAPQSNFISRELINVKPLDSVINTLCDKTEKVYLKIDTQGYERYVLKGAEKSLERIETIQLEMSLTPLYEGELPYGEMHDFLSKKDYNLVSIETGFTDPVTGQLLQVDGIYHRF